MSRSAKICLVILCFQTTAALSTDPPLAKIVIGKPIEKGGAPQPGPLHSPFGVDFDAKGNMYIVELGGGRVHMLDTQGQFTTIAGQPAQGYAGDGEAARNATFNGMHNIAVTPQGDLYIADSWNHCIRKIDRESKIISTIAGTGEAGFRGDGGSAKSAQFDFLMCITLNQANDKIYCADLKNRRIRVVDLKHGTIDTVAGNGLKGVPQDGAIARESPLVDPRAVAVDSQDNVYILERAGNALRRVTTSGKIYTVAGTGKNGDAVGPALQAQFGSPKHLAIDHDDNVLIADDLNARIVKYDAREQTITPILGKGVAEPRVTLSHPHGVSVHRDGSIYVVDTGHHRIFQLCQEVAAK